MAGDESQDFIPARIQNRYIVRADHLRRRERDIGIHPVNVVSVTMSSGADIPQRPEERIAVSGERHVADLARQRSTRNMAHRAAQCPVVVSFHHHHGETQARISSRPTKPALAGERDRNRYRLLTLLTQPLEVAAFPPLEKPGVGQNKRAITQKQRGAAKKRALQPYAECSAAFLLAPPVSFGIDALLDGGWDPRDIAGASPHHQLAFACARATTRTVR